MSSSRALSLRTRAALAVALLVGFYLFALSVAGGLLWVPVALWEEADRVNLRIALICLVGAFAILRGIIPQRDKFAPPGPRLLPSQHPRLFAMLQDVARQTNQEMPIEVYLIPEVNAWVAQRGGFMGLGSRRVMAIGLPLMEALSENELRAVIAHEFGHYVSGDTKLGPWVFRTRAAIGRTLEGLAEHASWLYKPFEWYGLGFLRITQAVSRQQEFVADAIAARVAGAPAAASALRRIERAALAFGPYMNTELGPVIGSGHLPPVAAGFRQFLNAPSVVPELEKHLDEELKDGKSDPYDSHPSLRDRLAALEKLPGAKNSSSMQPTAETSSLGLLDNIAELEKRLILPLVRSDNRNLARIEWEDVPVTVYPTGWREQVEPFARRLADLTPRVILDLASSVEAKPGTFAGWLQLPSEPNQTQEDRIARADAVIGCAIALSLVEAMHRKHDTIVLEAPPGEPVSFGIMAANEVTEILPFVLVRKLAKGEFDADRFLWVCKSLGIESFGPLTQPALR
jgi:heat shock protein HtpX